MDILTTYIENRTREGWLVDGSVARLFSKSFQAGLKQLSAQAPSVLVLAFQNPVLYLAGFLAAWARKVPVCLLREDLSYLFWEQLPASFRQAALWCEAPYKERLRDCLKRAKGSEQVEWESLKGKFLMPTGGTSGSMRLAIHHAGNIEQALAAWRCYWGRESFNVHLALPLWGMGGLMPALRSLGAKGHLNFLIPWKRPATATWLENAQLSIVPLQLHAYLQDPLALRFLAGLESVFVGGGPPNPAEILLARQQGVPARVAYGLNETSGTVALEVHLSSKAQGPLRSIGSVNLRRRENKVLLEGGSLCEGYLGQLPFKGTYLSQDKVQWQGESFRLLGRSDSTFIRGGKKMPTELIERELLKAGARRVHFLAVPSAKWGLCPYIFVEGLKQARCQKALEVFEPHLRPRLRVGSPPLNASGKINWRAIEASEKPSP